MGVKIGDHIGGIWKETHADGSVSYILNESKVTRIVETRNGKKCHCRDIFLPMDVEDLESSTEIMENAKGFIVMHEPVILTPKIRSHFERWIEWANAHPGEVKSILED